MLNVSGYKILEKINEGKTSDIYRAADENNLKYILKVIKNDFKNNIQADKINNEYDILKNIESSKVIKTYGLKKTNNNIILILEDFNAISLKLFLKNNSSLNIYNFLQIAIKIANALYEIHKNNIIHGDIRPDNILINPQTMEVKITDFGISSNLNNIENNKINNFSDKDDIKYISPEQSGRINKKIDIRTDFYSLGIVFYEMLLKKTPFDSNDTMEIIHHHIAKKPMSPHEVDNKIPLTISNIIMKLLDKNIDERYKTDHGLIYDLTLCLNSIINKLPLDNIILGNNDLSHNLSISEKLYGKDSALKSILNLVNNFENNKPNILFIKGPPGVGKTYLIEHLNHNFLKNKYNIIKIKFDKTKTHSPYHCLIQGVKAFITNLIGQNKNEMNVIKSKIQENLNDDLCVLSSLISEINILTGENLQNDNFDKNTFPSALKKFLKIFSQKESPLIITIDNLSYADYASIDFITYFLNDNNDNYFNLIFSSKDNTDKLYSSPLKTKVTDLCKKINISIKYIDLSEFSINEINELLINTFEKKLNNSLELAHIIYLKTQGNPFFVSEFIKNSYQRGYISFKDSLNWTYDIDKIYKMEISKNVIDLILEKINFLTKETVEILKVASCLGMSFEIGFIEKIINKKVELELAIKNGIITRFYTNTSFSKDITSRFAHTKIYETFYSLLDEDNKESLHYKIYHLMKSDNKNDIYDLANHLNKSTKLIIKNNENINSININYKAASKAKESNIYNLALEYIRKAESMINEELWQEHYNFIIDVYIEYITLEYLNHNFDNAENLIELVFERKINDFDKAKIYEIKSLLSISANKIPVAVNSAIEGLKLLNIKIPTDSFNIIRQLTTEFVKLRFMFKRMNIIDLINLPILNEEKYILIMKLFRNLVASSYLTDSKLMFLAVHKMISISLKKGNSDFSPYAYVCYATFITYTLNDTKKGYELSQVALKLSENKTNIKSRVIFIYAAFIHHWVKHDRKDIEMLSNNINLSIKTNDTVYIGYSILHSIIKMFINGDKLDNIYDFIKYNSQLMLQNNQILSEELVIRTQMILCLKGLTYSYNSLSSQNFSEEKFFYKLKKSGNISRLTHAYIVKMQLLYFFENYEMALEYAEEAKKNINSCFAMPIVAEFYFFYSLVLTSLVIKRPDKYNTLRHMSVIRFNQKKMEKWAKNCPENYYPRYLLVEAELSFINNQYSKASEYYNSAIELMGKGGFLHYQGLANELSAKFYLAREHDLIAKEYIKEANLCYKNWGATLKVSEFEKKYSHFFNVEDGVNTTLNSLQNSYDSKLDLETVVKASQILSEEILLNRLTDKLMKIVVENAGAERGILILKNKDDLYIEAEGNINYEKTLFFDNITLESTDLVPHSIVNYVERTGKDIVIDDATTEVSFTSDYYIINKRPKSILCIPINKQQKLIGILYLENNLTKGAFTEDRIQVLKIIASQAAISLENARLYDEMTDLNYSLEQNKNNLEEIVDKRTRQLKITQKRLVDSAHRSGMAEIATGVLHNIGNILNGVNISNQVIIDKVEHSKIDGLLKANELLKDNIDRLEDFLLYDPKGKKLLEYYLSIGDILKTEVDEINDESQSLSKKIALMKDVISTQQSYAKNEYLNESVDPITIVEDAISIHHVSLLKSNIRIIKNYSKTQNINIHRAKTINILINLLKNSQEALESNNNDKYIKIDIYQNNYKSVTIKFSDNGEGILKENINKIFSHGFTTKTNGHGFGLHTCANSMVEMGGKIVVESDGSNKGATFILTFPIYA